MLFKSNKERRFKLFEDIHNRIDYIDRQRKKDNVQLLETMNMQMEDVNVRMEEINAFRSRMKGIEHRYEETNYEMKESNKKVHEMFDDINSVMKQRADEFLNKLTEQR